MIRNEIKKYTQLPFKIHIILLSTVVNRVGDFVGPFLSLLLSQKMGFTPAQTGFAVSLNAASSMVGPLIGGKLTDIFGSKRTRVLFQMLHAFSFFSAAFIKNGIILISILAIAAFFAGMSAPSSSTMIMENTQEQHRKSAYSLLYISINIGFSVAPLLAGLLYYRNPSLIFIGDAATSVVSALLIAIFVPKSTTNQSSKSSSKSNDISTFRILAQNQGIVAILAVIALNFIAFSQTSYALPLTAQKVLGEFGPGAYSHMLTFNALLCIILTPVITMKTRELKASTAIAFNSILFAIGFGLYSVTSGYSAFMSATLIWTTGEIIGAVNTDIYIANTAPETHRGRINALPPLMRRAGYITGPIIGGYIGEAYGLTMIWPVVAIICIIAAFIMIHES